MKNLILFTIIILPFQFLICQEMVTQIKSENGDKSSSPSDFIEYNNKIFFEATTENYGRELWIIENDETYLLKDISLGKSNGIVTPFSESSVELNNKLYFIASDENSKGEIWQTDGTSANTEKVTNFLNSPIEKLTLIDEVFYFLIKKDTFLQVWMSDGTRAGTTVIRNDLKIWNTPSFQGKCKNTFIFTFQPFGSNDSRVWRSDGTAIGTFAITDLIDGNGAGIGGTSSLTQYIEYKSELYFVSRYFLHKTDGTRENTVSITSFHDARNRLIDFADVIEVNNKLYFSFLEKEYNRLFIWETDGTEIGSTSIYDEYNDKNYLTSNLLSKNENLIFCSANENGRTSLTKMDLSNYVVEHFKELQDSLVDHKIVTCSIQHISNDRIFCSLPIDFIKRKGWISSCTEETTENIEMLNDVSSVFCFQNIMYFSKLTNTDGSELWQSDGTELNTKLVANINKTKFGLSSKPLILVNSHLLFLANDGVKGEEIWEFDGTNAVLLKDIREGSFGSRCNSFIEYNNEIFFVAKDNTNGIELWKTNGTTSGTNMVFDLNEGVISSNPIHLTIHQDLLYFSATVNGRNILYSTNGSSIDSIKDFAVNSFGIPISIKEIKSVGDYLYFLTRGAGNDLWISDGTEEGTYKIMDFLSIESLTEVSGKVFFTGVEKVEGENELWITNGTEEGTKIVKDIGVGYSSLPDDLFGYERILYFTAFTTESGREIWRTDGTEMGTYQFIELYSGQSSSISQPMFTNFNDDLYFSATNGEIGFELYKTNGTEAGTSLVMDMNPGMQSSLPTELLVTSDLLFFQAYDEQHGAELWSSNGTVSGTKLASDILFGNLSSCPSNIFFYEDYIYFIAESEDFGRQIWRITNNEIINVQNVWDSSINCVWLKNIDIIIHCN